MFKAKDIIRLRKIPIVLSLDVRHDPTIRYSRDPTIRGAKHSVDLSLVQLLWQAFHDEQIFYHNQNESFFLSCLHKLYQLWESRLYPKEFLQYPHDPSSGLYHKRLNQTGPLYEYLLY